MKIPKRVKDVTKSIPKIISHFANLATGLGLIWAIFTYQKSESDNAIKDSLNLREIIRIQKNDSTQLAILQDQYSSNVQAALWNKIKDSLSIEYSRRNLDTISSLNQKAIKANIEQSQKYLEAFTNVYQNMLNLQREQTETLKNGLALQENINSPLLEADSLKIDRIEYHFNQKKLALKVLGNFQLSNLSASTVRDLEAELLTVTNSQNNFEINVEEDVGIPGMALFEDGLHWKNIGIPGGRSKVVNFQAIIEFPAENSPKVIRCKVLIVSSCLEQGQHSTRLVYSDPFEIIFFKIKDIEYTYKVFSSSGFLEPTLAMFEKNSFLLKKESLDKYDARKYSIDRIKAQTKRRQPIADSTRNNLEKKIRQDIQKANQ